MRSGLSGSIGSRQGGPGESLAALNIGEVTGESGAHNIGWQNGLQSVTSTGYWPGSPLALSSMNEWNIQSRSSVCVLTRREFQDHESCHTVLLTAATGGFERLDISEDAWRTQGPEILSRPNLISHWKGEYQAPPPAPPEPIRRDDAESLLQRLVGLKDPQYAAACYILSVMLERKRLLKVKAQIRENGRRLFVYENPRTGDVFTIFDPDLQLNQLDAVQRQVADLLAKGPSPETSTAAGPEPYYVPGVVPSLPGEN